MRDGAAAIVSSHESNTDAASRGSTARAGLPWWRTALYVAFLTIYLVPFVRVVQQRTDDGIFVEGAKRIVNGRIYSVDFFQMEGFGTFYWLAAVIKWVGSILLARSICLFVSSAVTMWCLYWLSHRIKLQNPFLPCVIFFATYFSELWPAISPHTDSNCLALLAVVLLVLWSERQDALLLFGSGVTASLAACFMQQKALVAVAIVALVLVTPRSESSKGKRMWPLVAGIATPIAVAAAYFYSHHALGSVFYATILWPLRHYGSVNHVAYAYGIQKHWFLWFRASGGGVGSVLIATVLLAPFVFVALMPAIVALAVAQLKVAHAAASTFRTYLVCGTALWFTELHRMHIGHLVSGCVLLIIPAVYYFERTPHGVVRVTLQALQWTSVSLAIVNMTMVLLAQPVQTRAGKAYLFGTDPVLEMIDAHVPAATDVFIYPYCPMYYVLSSTTNPTRFSVLQDAFSSHDQFIEVIHNLEQRHVKYVVWDTTFQSITVPANFPSARPTGDGQLFESYLKLNFHVSDQREGFLLMERDEAAVPKPAGLSDLRP